MKRSKAIQKLKEHLNTELYTNLNDDFVNKLLNFLEQDVKMEPPKIQIKNGRHKFFWFEYINKWENENE